MTLKLLQTLLLPFRWIHYETRRGVKAHMHLTRPFKSSGRENLTEHRVRTHPHDARKRFLGLAVTATQLVLNSGGVESTTAQQQQCVEPEVRRFTHDALVVLAQRGD